MSSETREVRTVRTERSLILVKHAMPVLVSGVPAADWTLSEAGRRACVPLAARLATYGPTWIATSEEPKAAETGTLVAAELGLPVTIAPGLHEHDAGDTPILGDAQWQATREAFFARPDDLVFGRESANEAGSRFAGAVEAVTDRMRAGGVIVAHGRVISHFVARTNPIDPFVLSGELGLPSYVVLDPRDWSVIEVVGEVA